MNRESVEVVNKFIETAREYIELVDRHEELGKEKFLNECLKTLPLIFHYAVQLPIVEPDTTEISEREPDSDYKAFADFLGEDDGSNQVWDPVGDDGVTKEEGEWEVIYHSLADDLLDIYSDLKNPMMAIDHRSGAQMNDAVWEWKFGFQNHYGYHLASAIKALYWRMRYWSDSSEGTG